MKRINPYLLIFFIAAIMFTHSLGNVSLFDWDEINFAESAREMIETGNYMRVQINYEPFWEKPPLFFWMQVTSMQLFGVNEWAARLPNALCGIATLLVLFAIGKRLQNERFAYWWVLLYAGTFLPHLYFKSGIIDPWFNLFIFLGIYFLSRYLQPLVSTDKQEKKHLYFSALFTGLSVLTKGPVGLLVVVLTYVLFFFLAKRRLRLTFADIIKWGIGVVLVAMIWFGLEILQHGWWFVEEFVRYQIRLAKTKDAGHGGFFLYHFVVLLIGCFPASWLIFKPKTYIEKNDSYPVFRMMMISSLIVILVVFTLVRTKIVHYSSFAYLPIGYLAAQTMDGLMAGRFRMHGWQRWALLLTGIVWALLFIALPLLGNHIDWLKPLLKNDAFALANLEADVEWKKIFILPGLLFAFSVIESFILFKQHRYQQALALLLISCALSMQVLLTVFVPRIEKYSQHAAIEFYKTLQGKDVYVRSLGFKSYAPYFYSRVKPGQRPESKDMEWLLCGPVDKPTYFVSKITRKEKILEEHGERLIVLYEKNGFVFYQRK